MSPPASTSLAAEPALAVFRALDTANVRHCLWRGSPRLAPACAGESDFDLLIDARQADVLADVLARQGLRRASSHASRSVPGLEDWIGLAGPNGPLLHYHVHHRLVAGPGTTNHFRLPWEQQVLESRGRTTAAGILVAHPVIESGLLLLRCALQLRGRDRLPWAPAGTAVVAKVNGDLAHLLTAAQWPELEALLRRWLGSESEVLRECGIRAPGAKPGDGPTVTLTGLFRLRRLALRSIGHLAAMSGMHAAMRGWRHEARSLLRLVARRCRWPLLPNRVGLTGGLLVVLQDDSGERANALAASLRRLFGGKLDVFVAPPGARQLRRAQQARDRGMLAIAAVRALDPAVEPKPDVVVVFDFESQAAGPTVLATGDARQPPAVLRIDAEGDPESALASAVRALWNRL